MQVYERMCERELTSQYRSVWSDEERENHRDMGGIDDVYLPFDWRILNRNKHRNHCLLIETKWKRKGLKNGHERMDIHLNHYLVILVVFLNQISSSAV